MTVKCIESTISSPSDKIHVSEWFNSAEAPRRIILLFHGLMMHGKSFDSLARSLAGAGSLVVAPDLRGFGRSYFAAEGKKGRINYKKSLDDASKLLKELTDKHSELAVFCGGESLGAHLARGLVSRHPKLIAGLILSSPCLRPNLLSLPLIPYSCAQLMLSGLETGREFNMLPFASKFLKNEPENLKQYINDPLSRKSLEIFELIDSIRINGLIEPENFSPEIPILVLRGKNDCVCKKDSTKKFLESMKSQNMTIHGCDGCGHLILQSTEVNEEILITLYRWLEHVNSQSRAVH